VSRITGLEVNLFLITLITSIITIIVVTDTVIVIYVIVFVILRRCFLISFIINILSLDTVPFNLFIYIFIS